MFLMTFEGGGFSYERYLVSMNQYNGFHEQVFGENLLVAPRLCVGLVFLMPLGDSRKSESIQRTRYDTLEDKKSRAPAICGRK